MTFRRKVLFFAATVSLLSLFLVCSAIVGYDVSTFRRSMVETASAEADILAKSAASAIVFFDADFASRALAGLEAEPNVTAACIYTTDGTVFARYARSEQGTACPDTPRPNGHAFMPSHLEVYRPVLFEGEPVGTIFIRTHTDALAARVRNFIFIVLIAMGVSLFAAMLASFVFQKALTKPVMELAETARRVSGGNDYSARAQVYGNDELGELTNTFNKMLDQIQARDADLRRSEEQNRSLLESLDIGVSLINENYEILMANPEYCRRAGMTHDEILGQKCYRAMNKGDELCPECPGRETLLTGRRAEKTMEKTGPDGKPMFLRLHTYPLFNDRGGVRGFITLSEDITRDKLDEQEKEALRGQLIQAQKMEAVGQLAGGMAHDFNNMLAVIMGNASMGQVQTSPADPNFDRFNRILDASDRARALTQKLLTFSRKEQINVQDIWMHTVLDELVGMLSRTVDRSVAIKILVHDRCLVHIDKNQIQQALLNVCNNAVDAMPGGGTLTLECSRHTFDGSVCRECGKRSIGDFCMIQISDTGVGMSDEVRKKIMEPFFTTKGLGKGTGLGLSVTHGIVEGHEGHIHIYSEINAGTCVRIYLPLSRAAGETGQDPAERRIHTGTETVLVVDDEPEVLDTAAALLTQAGYAPIRAMGGDECLEIIRASDGVIDLVLLDMIMPGLSGRALYEELKKLAPGIPVLLSSGFSVNGQAGKLLEMGVQGFVQKPFDIYELTRAIREALDKPDQA